MSLNIVYQKASWRLDAGETTKVISCLCPCGACGLRSPEPADFERRLWLGTLRAMR